MKYQAIVTPDGLALHLDGPYEGRMNDISILHDSGLECRLDELLDGAEGSRVQDRFYLFGDKAYGSFSTVMSPFGSSVPPQEMELTHGKGQGCS